MTLTKAITQCFSRNNKPSNKDDILEVIIKNGLFNFAGAVDPATKVNYTLHRMYNKGTLERIKPTSGRGYLYFAITDEKCDDVPSEKILTLEERFEEVTGINFQSFYKKYKPKLVWYLTRYTRDQEIAEDFADDAFTQSLLKIDNYNSEKSQIHTWIYKIAENLVKKDFKDKKKMSVVSLDKENSENLNLINIIPSGSFEESNTMEQDSILIKKAEIVKDAIFNLPDKYKRVMILRELQNKPYIDIAEICVKDMKFELNGEGRELPSAIDFLDLTIENNSNSKSYVNITYTDDEKELTIQFDIKPFEKFFISKTEIENVSHIEIEPMESGKVHYRMTTNLSTIKSQISKGRQLIQSMVSKKFKILDDQGLPTNMLFGDKKPDIFEGDDSFQQEDDWF